MLVHCVGGISRSSTIVIAYLMLKHGYTLNDAYDFVKAKKSNVAPNFSFMQQLLDFESERTRANCQTPNSTSGVITSSVSPFSVDLSIGLRKDIGTHSSVPHYSNAVSFDVFHPEEVVMY